MNAPSRENVAQLAGFENLLDAVVVARRSDAGVLVARLAGTAVDVEVPLTDTDVGAPVRIALRAGDALLATAHPPGLSARNIIPGTVASLSQHGTTMQAVVDIGVPVHVHLTPTSSEALHLHAGCAIWLVIKTHSCHPVSTV